jgi:hypothetical protein
MKQENVQCPNCGHKFHVDSTIMHDQLQDEIRKEYDAKLISDKARLEKKIREQIQNESSEQTKELQSELQEKSTQVKELNKTKAEVERLKREHQELREQVSFEKEKEFSEKLRDEKLRIRKQADEENVMKIKELEKQLADQKELAEEMRRKADQGSVQLQGEVQELSMEDFLRANFPLDTIESIKTGAKGADYFQIVNTRTKQSAGSIYYESKRTKDFQNSWIEKFKNDMRIKGATFGMLVTAAYPKELERFGMMEGIWICSYEEFKGLCFVLRESIIMLDSVSAAEENKGDKMSLLYQYLTGSEFRMQIEAIVEGFSQMHTDLNKEKRAMDLIWKQREKQIHKVILNTTNMYASVKGIAGNAVGSIKALELPTVENTKQLDS